MNTAADQCADRAGLHTVAAVLIAGLNQQECIQRNPIGTRHRQQKAQAARQAGQAESHLNAGSDSHFESLQEKIDRMYAANDLNRKKPSADEIFRSMEEKAEIEKELEELKKEVNR